MIGTITVTLEVELVEGDRPFLIFTELSGDGETGQQVSCISDELNDRLVRQFKGLPCEGIQ